MTRKRSNRKPRSAEFFFFGRKPGGRKPGVGDPEGVVTVSKRPTLPSGEFEIIEYHFPTATLGFVESDNFTACDCRDAYKLFLCKRPEIERLIEQGRCDQTKLS